MYTCHLHRLNDLLECKEANEQMNINAVYQQRELVVLQQNCESLQQEKESLLQEKEEASKR